MRHGTLRLYRLVSKTAFFEDHHASLAPIVLAAGWRAADEDPQVV